MARTLSRREFVQIMGLAVAELLAAGCQPRSLVTPEATWPVAPTDLAGLPPPATPGQVPPTVTLRPTSTAAPAATATAAPPSTPAATAPETLAPPSATATALPADVAIARAGDYQPQVLRQQMQLLLDGLGGVGETIRPGDRVAIKVNLTGGSFFQAPGGLPATETYVTHPEVVRALGECLRDAGAGPLYIVEALFDAGSFARWGYVDVARALGATLVDLNLPDPYPDLVFAPVGQGWSVYDGFWLNPVLLEVDRFVSVAKMKCHSDCGVTLSMKNLVGLVPVSRYRSRPEDWWRSALHGDGAPERLPGVILDLNRARPIHLAVIDGIKTAEGGEVPRGSFNPVAPGVLLAGKQPVTTDAVATAVMGFDPTADYPNAPFLRSHNVLNRAAGHLALDAQAQVGLGTNRLSEIGIAGVAVDQVRHAFAPATGQ